MKRVLVFVLLVVVAMPMLLARPGTPAYGYMSEPDISTTSTTYLASSGSNAGNEIIEFVDKAFESFIRELIKKPEGPIYHKDVSGIKEITIMGNTLVTNENTMIENGYRYGYSTKSGVVLTWWEYEKPNEITSLADIRWFDSLESLNIRYSKITSLKGIGAAKNLRFIEMPINEITSLDGIEELKKDLEYLNLTSNKISDISALEKTKIRIEALHLGRNKIKDITPLKSWKGKNLYIDCNPIDDYSILEEMKREGIECYYNSDKNEHPIFHDGAKIPDMPLKEYKEFSLEDSILIYTAIPYAYVCNVKVRYNTENISMKPVMENDIMLVPVSFLCDVYGATLQSNAETAESYTLTYKGKGAVFNVGDVSMKLGKETFTLPAAPRVINGVLFVTADVVTEKLFDQHFYQNKKYAIISDNEAEPSVIEKALNDVRYRFVKRGQFSVSVDPRIELISVIKLLAGDYRASMYDSEYRNQVISYFKEYADHPAVHFFKYNPRISSAIMLHLSTPPGLTVQTKFSDQLIKEVGSEARIMHYVDVIRSFAKDTSFMDFFKACRGYYNKMQDRVNATLKNTDYTKNMVDYYGYHCNSFQMILCPLAVNVSYGPNVEWSEGVLDTYNLISALPTENDIPGFGTKERLREMIWHEFSHSYTNPLVDANWDSFEKFSGLMNSVQYKPPLDSMYGDNWAVCVYEHLVRAVTIRLAYIELGKEIGDRELKAHMDLGFKYLPELCQALEKYESNRDVYKTFEKFIPEILKVFESLRNKKGNAVSLWDEIELAA